MDSGSRRGVHGCALAACALAAAIASCKRDRGTPAGPPPSPSPSPLPPPTQPVAAGAPDQRLDWLPADTARVEHQPGAGARAELLRNYAPWLPHCVETSKRIDVVFAFSRSLSDPAVEAYHVDGALPTIDELAACASEYAARSETEIDVTQQGRFIVIAGKDARTHVIAAPGGWMLAHGDPSRLDAILARGSRLSDNRPMAALLDRVAKDPGRWIVSTVDTTSLALGVPSRGFVMQLSPPVTVQGDHVMRGSEGFDAAPTAILFASDADARTAHAALLAKAEAFPPVLLEALAAAHPTIAGAELHLDAAPVLRDAAAKELVSSAIAGH